MCSPANRRSISFASILSLENAVLAVFLVVRKMSIEGRCAVFVLVCSSRSEHGDDQGRKGNIPGQLNVRP